MIIIEFAIGLLVLSLVVMGVIKLADKLGVVELIRSWFKK
jgi:hypothetical protein